MSILDKYESDIQRLCRTHHVKSLYAFGSVLTDQYSLTSDIDLIVDFDNVDVAGYADNYFSFKFSLEDIFLRPIDLLEEKAIRNPYFRAEIVKNRRLVYGH
jgi:predicted nucleotidyltransferase